MVKLRIACSHYAISFVCLFDVCFGFGLFLFCFFCFFLGGGEGSGARVLFYPYHRYSNPYEDIYQKRVEGFKIAPSHVFPSDHKANWTINIFPAVCAFLCKIWSSLWFTGWLTKNHPFLRTKTCTALQNLSYKWHISCIVVQNLQIIDGTALIHHIQSLNVKRDFGFEMTSTY